MNKKLFLGIGVTVLAIIPLLSQGATFKAGESFYLESSSKTNGNLYAAGADVSIAGTVQGDLFTAGSNIVIYGPVGDDLLAAGGSVNLSGKVSGDTRVLGGNIFISNQTGGELIVLGGQINIASGSSVTQDAELIGGNIRYEGKARNLNVKGETVYINGYIKGNLSVEGREIKLGPNALVDGNFEYYSAKEAVMEEGAKVSGTTNFNQIEKKDKALAGIFFGFITLALFLKLLSIIIITLLAFYFCKKLTASVVGETLTNFWRETGRGFILLVVVPIASVLSFITVIGSPLGFMAMFVYVALIIASLFFTVLVFAKLVMKYVFKRSEHELNWWIITLSVLALMIISLIPIVGCTFVFVLFLATFGSLTNHLYKKLKE